MRTMLRHRLIKYDARWHGTFSVPCPVDKVGGVTYADRLCSASKRTIYGVISQFAHTMPLA